MQTTRMTKHFLRIPQAQAESLQHSLEQVAWDIGLYMNNQ